MSVESSNFGSIKGSSNRLSAVDRQIQALMLRRSGATYAEIAKQLGYAGHQGARKAVLSALRSALHEEVDALRSLELSRLDRMQLGLWTRAVDGVLRIMTRRAALLGLDAPTKVRHEGEIDVRKVAEDLASELGRPVEDIIAEAEQIIRESRDER